jgi:nitrate reductase beta subunit
VKEELEPRYVIQRNAKRVTELHDRIHETFKRRDTSPEARAEWSRACDEFHSQYDALAFPGGYTAGLQKIQAGDTRAIEDALAFLEVRPYFFRSQYIRTKLTRLLKHAQLTVRQAERFQRALESDKQKKRVRTPYA